MNINDLFIFCRWAVSSGHQIWFCEISISNSSWFSCRYRAPAGQAPHIVRRALSRRCADVGKDKGRKAGQQIPAAAMSCASLLSAVCRTALMARPRSRPSLLKRPLLGHGEVRPARSRMVARFHRRGSLARRQSPVPVETLTWCLPYSPKG